MLAGLGWIFLTLSLIGAAYNVFAGRQVARSAWLGRKASDPSREGRRRPSVTILKPLHGPEAGLFENLESFCLQSYSGPVQIVFGVHDIGDPAVRVVRDLQRLHPGVDIALVVDSRSHGENRKVSNLVNMEHAIRGEIVVISDSDIRVERDYLNEVASPLDVADVGYVTSLYTGRATGTIWSSLSAMGINYQFLPSVLTGVRLGMAHPCFGATIALRRKVLEEVGGFAILADQLADDYDLGRAIRAAGYRGELSTRPVVHFCDEQSWRELWSHEARWNRTIRLIDPLGFFGAAITYALAWAVLGCVLAPGAAAFTILTGVILVRLHVVDQVNRHADVQPTSIARLMLRDLMSFAVYLSAFSGQTVMWRGRRYRMDREGALHLVEEFLHASHPVPSSAFLRRLRWGRGVAVSGQARDQVVLVSDLARPAGGLGRKQPADRRPAA